MTDVNQRIAARVRDLRGAQSLSLDALASKTGVSRSMISLIERGESSPTAVVLEKLALGLGVTMATLFEAAAKAATSSDGPVSRRENQLEWKDPGSGYIRRVLSPPNAAQPLQLVEVCFPPGERVAFETAIRDPRIYQQIWMLDGTMEIGVGDEKHHLNEGDCLSMKLDRPTMFHNPTRKTARYLVAIVTETHTRR